jgi:hypothetical protein
MGVDSPDDCAVVAVGGNQGGKQMFNIHSVIVFSFVVLQPFPVSVAVLYFVY